MRSIGVLTTPTNGPRASRNGLTGIIQTKAPPLASIVVAITVVTSLVVAVVHVGQAAAVAAPPGTQVFTPPGTIAADCSQDVTKPLYDWINTLPEGTSSQPTEVQFASNGCYQVDGMVFLRGLTDFIFDGQGSKFEQSRLVNGELTNDPPPNRAAYCGFSGKFADATGTLPTGFDIMWFVEGGCDLVFENMDIVGTNAKAKPGGQREQDSAIEVAGSERVLITSDTINAVWGDFVTITGLHEANFGGLNFPAFDVTVTDNSFNHSGRQGVSIVYADRVTVTGNTVKNVPATAIDLEAEVGGGIEGNIEVTNNTFHGYAYLVAAITYAQLFDFAFTDNKFAEMKVVLESKTKFPGHDFSIGSNSSSEATTWNNAYDILLSNEATGLVPSNTVALGPPTPDFVSAAGGSGLISVQDNILNSAKKAPRTFLPDPLIASGSAVATGCDNASSAGKPLDGKENPSELDQCVTVSPVAPTAANLPSYLAGGTSGSSLRVHAQADDSTSPSGSQPGTVGCSNVTGTVTFNPPLIDGGTSPEVVLAQVTLSGCVGADGALSPDTGYGTVSLISPSNDCSSLESGGAPISSSLAVGWSPTTLGTSSVVFPGFSLSSDGNAGFSLGGAGTTVSGSYPGADAGASTTATASSSLSGGQIGAACASSDGLDSLTIDGGTLNLG